MDVDYFINNDNIFSTMLYLSYYDLMTICCVNTIIRQISNNDKFWQTKITLDYDYLPLIPGKTWKQMYKFFIPIFKSSVLENYIIPEGIEVLFKPKGEDNMILG